MRVEITKSVQVHKDLTLCNVDITQVWRGIPKVFGVCGTASVFADALATPWRTSAATLPLSDRRSFDRWNAGSVQCSINSKDKRYFAGSKRTSSNNMAGQYKDKDRFVLDSMSCQQHGKQRSGAVRQKIFVSISALWIFKISNGIE